MAKVKKKDPGKPGYMSTEFWAMALYGLHTLGSKVGLSSESVDEAVSSFSGIFQDLGDNPITSGIFGIVIVVYTIIRGSIKKAEISANSELAIAQAKRNPHNEVS